MSSPFVVYPSSMTDLRRAAYVKGRNNFRNNGQDARIGAYAFGFTWAAAACFLIASMLFCMGGSRSKDRATYTSKRRNFFGGKRSRSTRSRGSFINGNKEYS